MRQVNKAYFGGGGIGSLAGAFYLINDGHMKGSDITIYETLPVLGGSMDAMKVPSEEAFTCRGGRMFNFPTYENTWPMFAQIPSLDHPGKSIYDEVIEFNKIYKGNSHARVVSKENESVDVTTMGFDMRDRLDLLKLIMADEDAMGDSRITEWFQPHFFQTNFWYMWSTTFAFQPWHSAAELYRYMHRFMHEFPRIHTLEGIARTPYNQFDSVITPMQKYLKDKGVNFVLSTTLVDVDVVVEGEKKKCTSLTIRSNGKDTKVPVSEHDIVILQNGSMTDASSYGSMTEPAKLRPKSDATSWAIWEKLAKISPDFGNPEPFTRCVKESLWQSFTITFKDNTKFFDQEVKWSGNEPGTGGIVTFKDSNWYMSIVLAHQPHYKAQPSNYQCLWGYGLYPDRVGNFVNKKMIDCNGQEILTEVIGHLHFDPDTIVGATCIPCIMPYITAQFMTRKRSDRPLPVPKGSVNIGFSSQFVEVPEDCVFTVEYSVRSARMAVYQLLNIKDKKVAPVSRHDQELPVMVKSVKKAFQGSGFQTAFRTVFWTGLTVGAGFVGKVLYDKYVPH